MALKLNSTSGSITLDAEDGSGNVNITVPRAGFIEAWTLEDADGTEVNIGEAKEVKFIGDGITINWTDTDGGTDADPYDLTFTIPTPAVGSLDRGSIIYGNASGATAVLGQGTADQVLTSDGTDIAWANHFADEAQDLTDGATVNWDISAGNVARWTIAGNRTLAAPTNGRVGSVVLKLTQDGTGSRTVTWNSTFKWSAGAAPVLSTAAGAIDILSFIYDGSNYYGALVSRGAS